MSNLFDYIYEKKSMGNLLCSGKYGIYIFITDMYCRIHKVVYYNGKNVNNIEYGYKGFINLGCDGDGDCDSDCDFDDCIIEIIRCGGVVRKFTKDADKVTMWCMSYKKMCGDKEYYIELRPVVPSNLFTGEEFDVYIRYRINNNMVIKIWLDLKNNKSYLSTCEI